MFMSIKFNDSQSVICFRAIDVNHKCAGVWGARFACLGFDDVIKQTGLDEASRYIFTQSNSPTKI